MKCYYHNDRDGVGLCKDCGKVLCKECVDKYSPPLCSDCAEERNSTNKLDAITEIILSIIAMIFGGFIYFIANDNLEIPQMILFIIMWGGLPYGWAALNRITPSFFLILPVIGWILYFLIKLTIAMYIGWIILLIRLGKNIYSIIKVKMMSDYINKQNKS